jgi:hypothetical protein
MAPDKTLAKTATIRTRIEPGLKREVEAILSELGLDRFWMGVAATGRIRRHTFRCGLLVFPGEYSEATKGSARTSERQLPD